MTGRKGYLHSNNTISQFIKLADFVAKKPDIRDKKYDINKTAISYRTINYWESVGLLDDQRKEQGHGWRKFSIVDIVFISLINHLRNLGLSLEKLQNTKKSLTNPLVFHIFQNEETVLYKPDVPMTAIEFAYYRAVALKDEGNTYLLVETNGYAEVMTDMDLQFNRVSGELPDTYILINLNQLFQKNINKNIIVWDELAQDILLDFQLDKKVDKITIQRKNGKITITEKQCSGTPKEFENLHNLIPDIGYGEVTLTIKDGKACNLRTTKNEKFRDVN